MKIIVGAVNHGPKSVYERFIALYCIHSDVTKEFWSWIWHKLQRLIIYMQVNMDLVKSCHRF